MPVAAVSAKRVRLHIAQNSTQDQSLGIADILPAYAAPDLEADSTTRVRPWVQCTSPK